MAAKNKQLVKLQKEYQNAKRADTKQEKKMAIEELQKEIERLEMPMPSTARNNTDNVILPSCMLLIDEPEIGLHPNAIRAARNICIR